MVRVASDQPKTSLVEHSKCHSHFNGVFGNRSQSVSWILGSLPKPNLRILSSSRYKDPLFLEISCSSWPPDTHKSQESKPEQCTINILRWPPSTSFLFKLLYSAADGSRESMWEETWERALHDDYRVRVRCWVHLPDVCPCRECVCMCVCCVRSIVLSIWNMRRSSSSKAMSPQNTAGS